MKQMLSLAVLLALCALPMQGQKQGSDYVLHIRHLDAAGTGQVKSYTYYDRGKTLYRATSWTLQAASTRRYCR